MRASTGANPLADSGFEAIDPPPGLAYSGAMLVRGKEPAVSTCYSQPRIRDYGDLIELTASDFLGSVHAVAGVTASLPATNHETSTSGGPLGVLGQTSGPQSTPNTPQSPGVLGTTQGPSATPIAGP